MQTGTWRCFVAVPIPDALRNAIMAARETWMSEPGLADVRWTDPAAWHLTLAFLGSLPPADVEGVARWVATVAGRHREHAAKTGGLGAFPDARHARVVWYGVDGDGAFGALAADLWQTLSVAAADPFRPHITLARARGKGIDVRSWLSRSSPASPSAELAVVRIDVMRSHLGTGPARYERLASYELRG